MTPLARMREGVSPAWNDFIADEREIGGGLAWWESTVADEYVKPGDRILVIGCGSGRDVVAFLGRGCVVSGIDPAEGALSRARAYLKKHGGEATLECGFFEDWNREQVFDVVWFSWFVYGYVPDSKRRIQMLKQASRNVSPDGCVVVSYPTNPPRSRAAALARFAQRLWRSDWTLEEGDVIGRAAGTSLLTYEHRFTRAQIEQETRAAGFHPVLFADPIVVLRRA
jgi:SAM-dependent methyltransferase